VKYLRQEEENDASDLRDRVQEIMRGVSVEDRMPLNYVFEDMKHRYIEEDQDEEIEDF
jgi:hypothetical protein